MTNATQKAYVIYEGDEGNCAIVFASNGATARREGAGELALSFEEVESCKREPAFDQYAPGPVPLHATLAAGWWHECSHCGVRFDQDERQDGDDEDREDAFDPVQDASRRTFCSPACMMQHWAERRERKARECAAIEAALTRWPMAAGVKAGEYYKGWPSNGYEMRAQFTLPGLKYPVTWTPGGSTAMVSRCDVDEFTRLYGARSALEGGAP